MKKKELRSSLTTLEIDRTGPEIDTIFKRVDTDGSGEIDWDEFVVLMVSFILFSNQF